jgi:hypothetical protein
LRIAESRGLAAQGGGKCGSCGQLQEDGHGGNEVSNQGVREDREWSDPEI